MSGLCSVCEWLELLSVYQGCTRVCCLASLSPVPRAGQEGTWLMRSLNVNTIQQNWHCSTASPRVSPCSCAPASQTEEGTLVHHSLLSMPAHTNAHTHHLVVISVNTHTPAAHTTHREGVQEGRARVCTLCSQETPLQQLHVLHTLIGLTAVITCQSREPSEDTSCRSLSGFLMPQQLLPSSPRHARKVSYEGHAFKRKVSSSGDVGTLPS